MSDIQHEAARPKRSNDASAEEAAPQEPMRGLSPKVIKRNPSEDQKRIRRQIQRGASVVFSYSWDNGGVHSTRWYVHPETDIKHLLTSEGDGNEYCLTCGQPHPAQENDVPKVATTQQIQVAGPDGRFLINPGDNIRTPTGQTMKVRQIRRHETNPGHYYLDTDAGNTVVKGTDKFHVVPYNSQQQEMPGMGTPGGNSNSLPMDPQGARGNNQVESDQCPVCGGHGSLHRQGDHYSCSRCGYQEQVGAGGAGHNFSDAPHQFKQYSTVSRTLGAVAERARSVLESSKETDQ